MPRPTSNDPRLLAMPAAFAELLAQRSNQTPPAWTKEIGAFEGTVFSARIGGDDEAPAPSL